MLSLPAVDPWWQDCKAPGRYWVHWFATGRPPVAPHEGERSPVAALERQQLSVLHFSVKGTDQNSNLDTKTEVLIKQTKYNKNSRT